MDVVVTPPNSPLYSGALSVVMAALAVLDAFNVWHATDVQKSALLALFVALSGLAALLVPILMHWRAQTMNQAMALRASMRR